MKKILFLVQGEGRGHMTQAIALAQMLPESAIQVMVGKSPHRQIPGFFQRAFPGVEGFASLNFAFDARHRSVSPLRTVLSAVAQLPTLRRSVQQVRARIAAGQPDLIVNFFEPLGAWAARGSGVPSVAVGHQFLFEHPQTPFPPGRTVDRVSFLQYMRFFFGHSDAKLALSAYPAPPHKNIVVVPPLLRAEVFALRTTRKNLVLAYLVNKGYASDVGQWGLPTVCFWDNTDVPRRHKVGKVLFHHIDDRAYLRFMAHCRCLVTTAGFESMCEAAYLEKPMVLVPVEGHFEQLCNATDAAHHRIATHATSFTAVDPRAALPPEVDRAWIASARAVIVPLLQRAAKR